MTSKHKKSVTFAEAVKATSVTPFSIVIKPVGALCNLDCDYCYYLDKAGIYNDGRPKMDDITLEELTRQYTEQNNSTVITFNWHGGEPLLAGMDFFRKAIALQEKYKGDKVIENTIQTNATLITQEWCDFFREHNFLVGVSIDGPEDIHDKYRVDKGGLPTFNKVIRSIELMARAGVEYNTLSTINNLSEGRGREVHRFLKSTGSHYMQFLPVVEHVLPQENGRRAPIVPPNTPGSVSAEWSVSSRGFGDFMNDIFDAWIMSDVGQYYVQLFDITLAQWVGVRPSLCSFCETCGDSLAVEHNGDVYSCDHYVYPEYRLGNIRKGEKLTSMLKSPEQFNFGIGKRNFLPAECIRCKWIFACRGGCQKHRFDTSDSGEAGLNALCEGYKTFFNHAEPYMKYMADLPAAGQPPAKVMLWARQRMGFR